MLHRHIYPLCDFTMKIRLFQMSWQSQLVIAYGLYKMHAHGLVLQICFIENIVYSAVAPFTNMV